MASAQPERADRSALPALVIGTSCVVALDVAAKTVGRLENVRRWLDVGLENNVPTAWTVLLLLVLARRLWRHREVGPGWRAASLVALVLAVDEWVGWHEHLRVVGEELRDRGAAAPTYAWVLPGVVVAVVAVAAASPWLRSLPCDVRRRVLLGLLVFCGGALGVEAVAGAVHHLGGSEDVWAALTSVEETLEMVGILLAVSAFGTRRATEARMSAAMPTREAVLTR